MKQANDPKGEQVFSGDVDEILAEKIIKRTRQNKRNHSTASPVNDTAGQEAITESTPDRKGHDKKLFIWAMALAGLATVTALAIFGWRRSRD
jgi:hypothetical protein